MIDLNESLLSLPETAKLVPRRRAGRKVATSTIYRWINRGVAGIRLEALSAGGGLVTSREALDRFFRDVTAARRADRLLASGPRVTASDAAATVEADRVFGPRATQLPVDRAAPANHQAPPSTAMQSS